MTPMGRLALRLKAEGVAEVHRVAFLRALEAGLALEDLVIVPRKATQAMLKAIQPGYASEYASAESHWNTMIAEATKP